MFADHYSRARPFFLSQPSSEQAHIASAFVFELSKVGIAAVQALMVANFRNFDDGLAQRVADRLNIPLPKTNPAAREPVDLPPSDALSIQKNAKPMIKGRHFGILIADGSDAAAFVKLKKAITDAGAKAVIVAPKVGGAKLSDGKVMKADRQLAGSPSQLYDGVAVVLSEDRTTALLKESAAVEWLTNAFVHLKAIGHTTESHPLLKKAGVEHDEGVVLLDDFVAAAGTRYFDREPKVRTLA
ncbi:hypothetical protein ABAC402_03375 [Asticcacaulis sp. AC402]|nr:hypothetical protein ABAC402_03375 [Asticcacaulis sp. AC402]